MTDIAGSYSKIQQEEVNSKSAASEYVMTKIGAAINGIISGGAMPIGTVLSSVLTTAQFQAIMGTNWERINETGLTLTGTDLGTLTGLASVPALPVGYGLSNAANSSLSAITSGQNKQHTHGVTDPTHSHTVSVRSGIGASTPIAVDPSSSAANQSTSSSSTGISIQNEGSASGNLLAGIKVNFFIKVNID